MSQPPLRCGTQVQERGAGREAESGAQSGGGKPLGLEGQETNRRHE